MYSKCVKWYDRLIGRKLHFSETGLLLHIKSSTRHETQWNWMVGTGFPFAKSYVLILKGDRTLKQFPYVLLEHNSRFIYCHARCPIAGDIWLWIH